LCAILTVGFLDLQKPVGFFGISPSGFIDGLPINNGDFP